MLQPEGHCGDAPLHRFLVQARGDVLAEDIVNLIDAVSKRLIGGDLIQHSQYGQVELQAGRSG